MNMMPHIANAISFDLSPIANMIMAQAISDIDSLNISHPRKSNNPTNAPEHQAKDASSKIIIW
jgi:hypothetical protein